LKDVDSRVFTRMLRKDGRTAGSVTISPRNFVGEGIIMSYINLNCVTFLQYDFEGLVGGRSGTLLFELLVVCIVLTYVCTIGFVRKIYR